MNPLKHWKTILGLIVVFGAGLLIGSIVTTRAIQNHIRQRQDPATWTPRTLEWLSSDVQITPEQVSQLRPIVERSMSEMAELHTRTEAERKQLFARLFTEIHEQLSEPERERLQAAIQRAIAKDRAFSGATQ